MEGYSENAIKAYKNLYLICNENEEPTETIEQCHLRISNFHGDDSEEKGVFKNILDDQVFRVNTPAMANAGVKVNPILSACFPAGTLINTKENGLVPIENIKTDDEVLTHRGRFKKVKNPMKREYKGPIYHIKPTTVDSFETTNEHPIYIIPKKEFECIRTGNTNCNPINNGTFSRCYKKKNHYKNDCEKLNHDFSKKLTWKNAEELEEDDHLIITFNNEINNDSIGTSIDLSSYADLKTWNIDEECIWYRSNKKMNRFIKIDKSFLLLMGYFAAEGTNTYSNRVGFSFDSNGEERYINHVRSIIESKTGVNPSVKINEKSGSTSVFFFRKPLHNFIAEEFGKSTCYEFSLPKWLMELDPEFQKTFLIGFLRGDAHLSNDGMLSISLSNQQLAQQIWELFLRQGIIANIHKRQVIVNNNEHETYQIHVQLSLSNKNLVKDIWPENPIFLKEEKHAHRRGYFIDENKIAIRIKEIETYNKKQKVYNLEVEDDHTYTIRNIIVHNCFIIGLEDDMDSIINMWSSAARIYEGGGGCGIPITNLREQSAWISSGGFASGPLSYLHVIQSISDQVKSGGRNRRAANLVSYSCYHPDASRITKCKNDKQSFHAMNLSILVDNNFMRHVDDDDMKTTQVSPKNGPTGNMFHINELWNTVVDQAWNNGDPGLLFYDRINKDNPTPSLGDIRTSNPCFTGDAKVWTIYGPKTFRELAEKGNDIPVLSQNKEGKLEFKTMHNPRRSRRTKQELVRVHFDDGSYLDCTPDHEWYVRSKNKGTIKIKAKNLKPNQSISSVYRYNANQHGRKRLTNGIEDPLQHHVVVEWKEGRRPEYPFEHCHHIDKDKTNDIPENLKIMNASEHNAESMFGEQNPMHGIWDERNPLYKEDFSGKNNPRYYHHITKEMVLNLKRKGHTIKEICNKLDCSEKVIWNRLGNNHKVAYVEKLAKKKAVYNGTVEDNHNYFVMVGDNDAVLVANCGEVVGMPWTACVLGHWNLNKFLYFDYRVKDLMIDWERFDEHIYWGVLFLNKIIDKTAQPNDKFHKMMQKLRPIGMGFMGLADVLFKLRIPYGSEEAQQFVDSLQYFLTKRAFEWSKVLAEEGICPKVDIPPEDEQYFYEFLEKFGVEPSLTISNTQVTCIAPTGSTSISADCSYGFEPHMALVWSKKLSDSDDVMHFFDQEFKDECEDRDIPLTEHLVDEIKKNKGSIRGINDFPKDMQEVFVTAHDLNWKDRINMQAAAQKWITMSISSTVNLPNSATKDDVSNVYQYAWQQGLKGITIFRDGCLDSQPVNFGGDCSEAKETATESKPTKRERPEALKGTTHKLKTGSGTLYLTMNELDGEPFEVFATLGKSGRTAAAKAESLGRMTSLALRSGVPIEDIINQLEGIGGDYQIFQNGMLVKSIPDAIAHILKQYKDWGNESNPVEDVKAMQEEMKSNKGYAVQEIKPAEKILGSLCPKCAQPTLRRDSSCRGGECTNPDCFYSNCS